jgi:hypothetical protein
MFASANHEWLAVRDVAEVDGKPVRDAPDLKTALLTLPGSQVAATFRRYNSKFNVGRIARNLNEPTLSLLVLDSSHRANFAFDRKGVTRKGDSLLVSLVFREKGTPTLIQDPLMGDVPSEGEFTLEAGTGRIRRAVLKAQTGSVKAELTTEYAPDNRMGMWVPAVFREHYENGVPVLGNRNRSINGNQYEEIVCKARYTNFRRFETTGRIK